MKKELKNLLKVKQGYNPEHMELWERASNYCGPDYSNYYIVLGCSRDSDILTTSNYEYARDLLEDRRGVTVLSFSHWACGFFDFLAVDKNRASADTLKACDEIVGALKDYPVLDDDHYHENIREEIDATIHNLSNYELTELADFIGFKNDAEELRDFAAYMVEASEYYYGAEEIYLFIEKRMVEEAASIIEDNRLNWPSEEIENCVKNFLAA